MQTDTPRLASNPPPHYHHPLPGNAPTIFPEEWPTEGSLRSAVVCFFVWFRYILYFFVAEQWRWGLLCTSYPVPSCDLPRGPLTVTYWRQVRRMPVSSSHECDARVLQDSNPCPRS